MHYLTKNNLIVAQKRVSKYVIETPTYKWPLLCKRAKRNIWIKHENFTPISSFKIRGGINYICELLKQNPAIKLVTTASTGNHGQSVSMAAKLFGLKSNIYMPKGISKNKIDSIIQLGGKIKIIGNDFDEAREAAISESKKPYCHFINSFDPWLVAGGATYAIEVFNKIIPDYIYVPIGLGSGCVGLIMVRNFYNHKTKIIGVQAEGAPSYALSYKQKKIIKTNNSNTIAEGLATRVPDPMAFKIINNNIEDIILVSDNEMIESQNIILNDTRSIAEPAGAASLAGLLKDNKDNKTSVAILSGGNINLDLLKTIINKKRC